MQVEMHIGFVKYLYFSCHFLYKAHSNVPEDT